MPIAFAHETKPQRVLFGAGRGAGNLADAIAALGGHRPVVLAGDRHRSLIDAAALGSAPRFGRIVEHVPVEVAEQARSFAGHHAADVIIAIGGGSATGLAKAVALTSRMPVIAVPTTFAGSEATDVWGLTEGGRKRTGVDPRVLPTTVVYDPQLLASLPPALAAASGLNAVAHCVDAMWGPRTDPIDRALAMDGLRALGDGLPKLAGGDPDGVEQALYGGYLAAVAFASAGAGLHHKICHVLGGAFSLPHAATHAVVLPYVLAFNAPFAPTAAHRIAAVLDDQDASEGLERLRRRLDAPRTLRELGLRAEHIAAAVALIEPESPPGNPRPVGSAELTTLLHAAWIGEDPRGVWPEASA